MNAFPIVNANQEHQSTETLLIHSFILFNSRLECSVPAMKYILIETYLLLALQYRPGEWNGYRYCHKGD